MTKKHHHWLVHIGCILFIFGVINSFGQTTVEHPLLEEYHLESIKEKEIPDLFSDAEKEEMVFRRINITVTDKKDIVAKLFMGFDLLRSQPKHVSFIWVEWSFAKMSWVENVIKVDDLLAEELLYALKCPIYRKFSSFTVSSGIRGSLGPPDRSQKGIILETDKQRIIIGMTEQGFNLGYLKNKNSLDVRLIFYSPRLAYAIKNYLDKYPIKGFPEPPIALLSGEMEIECEKSCIESDEETNESGSADEVQ